MSTLEKTGALALTAVPAAAQHFGSRDGAHLGGGAHVSGVRGGSFGGGMRIGGTFNGGFRSGGFRGGDWGGRDVHRGDR